MDLIEILDREKLSLLIYKNGKRLYEAREGGVAPLMNAIEALGTGGMEDSIVADKIVGRAAALLMIYSEVKEVNAKTISSKAIIVLGKHSMPYRYQKLVKEILNRDKTGICIFEQAVRETEDPSEALRKLRAKLQSLQKKN
jgi:hypothetical protein